MPPRSDAKTDQLLPKNELKEFLNVQRLYDQKNFKRALKGADGILAKYPEHGETLSMKGLLLNQLNRKEEAHEFCKSGLKHNLRSPTCWHVYGLVHKSDRNYLEACKCFKNAIRMDGPDSPNLSMILRDLSQMQLQLRDIAGFVESRAKFLGISNNLAYTPPWVSLALGYHLAKKHQEAVNVLRRLQLARSQGLKEGEKSIKEKQPYEYSEIYLYEAFIYKDGGMYDKALEVLDMAEAEGAIRDIIGAKEIRAELYALLGRKEEAGNIYRELLDANPENHRYHERLIEIVRANGDSEGGDVVAKLEAMYAGLEAKYPKSRSCKRIPLDFDLPGERFKERLRSFVLPYVQRGIPSLFAELAPLYVDANKRDIIGEMLLELQSSCADGKEELFWVELCLAMHYSTVGKDVEAVSTIDRVIGKAPDDPCRIDAYSTKSKILDVAGDYLGSAEVAEEARKLDLADRYLNCQSSVALFKALRAEDAEDVSHLFTKGGNNNFFDMQATWYEMASGQCYAELKDYGRALKRFKKVEEHYRDFIDDQFDFFVYCTTKLTMRAYVEMLRVMDSLHTSKILAAAVDAAVRVYIHLSEHPFKTETELLEERVSTMSPEEAKTARRELQEKLEQEEVRERQRQYPQEQNPTKEGDDKESKTNGNAKKDNKKESKKDKDDSEDKKVDPDPKGLELAKTKDPLGDAKKMVEMLLTGAPDELTTHLLAYRVDVRRAFSAAPMSSAKRSLPLKHVRSAVRVAGASHPRVHECIVDYAVRSAAAPGVPGTKDEEAAAAEIATLLGSESIAAYHAAWKANNSIEGLEATIVSAKVDGLLAGSDAAKATAAWTACAATLKSSPKILRSVGHEKCREILVELVADGDVTGADAFRAACGSAFPLSNVFAGDLGLSTLKLA